MCSGSHDASEIGYPQYFTLPHVFQAEPSGMVGIPTPFQVKKFKLSFFAIPTHSESFQVILSEIWAYSELNFFNKITHLAILSHSEQIPSVYCCLYMFSFLFIFLFYFLFIFIFIFIFTSHFFF